MDVIAQNYASVEDPQYLEQRPSREATFWKHLQSLERYSGSGEGRRLLDIGAYIGVFVDTANQAGWQSTGLEPSAWASSYAVRSGLDVVCGTLETADFPPESFDVITMWDVFEHLSDPMGALDRCYSWLKPGGWIANHTMDIDSLFARLMGRRWPWLMEMHIYYFSNHTLTAIHEKAGFRVESVRPEGRYIRLTYLTTRMRPYSNLIANAVDRVSHFWGLENFMVPINFGDLVTIYAQKPLGE
jgi:cyclopropane fatty-acyl-phospholipid synthase-like methyltransferase